MSANPKAFDRGSIVVLLFSCTLITQASEFAGGTGEPNDPYQIATADQLLSLGSDPQLLRKHFVLVQDINLDPNLPGGRVFSQAVIAPCPEDPTGPHRVAFGGTFDGRGHVVKNLAIRTDAEGCLGLFGVVWYQCRISDLGMENVRVEGGQRVGGLVGWSVGTIDHCYMTGTVSGSSMVGGLAGQCTGTISASHAAVSVQGKDYSFRVGGLVGMLTGGIVTDCYATGDVTVGSGSRAAGGLAGSLEDDGVIANSWAAGGVSGGHEADSLGGLAGRLLKGGRIKGCYATGPVVGAEQAKNLGGLAGSFFGYAITDCYATGAVTGGPMAAPLGGLVGLASPVQGSLTDCYAIGKVTGENMSGGLGGLIGDIKYPEFLNVTGCFWDVEATGLSTSAAGKGLPTSAMQDITTYQAAGWDLAGDPTDGTMDTWRVGPQGGYLELAVFAPDYAPHPLAGSGTLQDPYRIENVEDLSAIHPYDRWICYALTADIDLAGIVWTRAPIQELAGTFHGKGHRIRHLTIRSRKPDHLGFFGEVRLGNIYHLALEDVSIVGPEGARGVGGLAGVCSGGISRCYVTGAISAGHRSSSLGALVGDSFGGVIMNCYASASVSVGEESSDVGGLIGFSYATEVIDCYASGRLSAGNDAEGLGGLVGTSTSPAQQCFWDIQTGGTAVSSAGTGLTTAQMRTIQIFLDAGWDFVGETRNGTADIWWMPQGGGYPVLTIFSHDD